MQQAKRKLFGSFLRRRAHDAAWERFPLVCPGNSKSNRKGVLAAGRFAPASRLILHEKLILSPGSFFNENMLRSTGARRLAVPRSCAAR
jgi:hypothetical protein